MKEKWNIAPFSRVQSGTGVRRHFKAEQGQMIAQGKCYEVTNLHHFPFSCYVPHTRTCEDAVLCLSLKSLPKHEKPCCFGANQSPGQYGEQVGSTVERQKSQESVHKRCAVIGQVKWQLHLHNDWGGRTAENVCVRCGFHSGGCLSLHLPESLGDRVITEEQQITVCYQCGIVL